MKMHFTKYNWFIKTKLIVFSVWMLSLAMAESPLNLQGNAIINYGQMNINDNSWSSGFDYENDNNKPFVLQDFTHQVNPGTYNMTVELVNNSGPANFDVSQFKWMVVYIGYDNGGWIQHTINTPNVQIASRLARPISQETVFSFGPNQVFNNVHTDGQIQVKFMFSCFPLTATKGSYTLDYNIRLVNVP